MNKETFMQEADVLLARIDKIDHKQYLSATKLVNDLQILHDKYAVFMAQYVLEDLWRVEEAFKKMTDGRDEFKRMEYCENGCRELSSIILAMKSENKFV